VDTLIVLGGWSFERAIACPALIANVRRLALTARRVGSVCAGSFVLGAAGLLDGRRATTHWAACALLQERCPRANIEPDRIFVRDGRLWTSGGATSGIDLALALVEEDYGAALVRRLGRWMVVFLQRPGGGSQFSERLSYPLPVESPLRTLLDSIVANPAADHSLAALAKGAAMSQRHLTRLFEQQMGTTPARFVERVRVEAARARLEESSTPLAAIARQSGFGTVETMRRSFRRVVGVTPAELRSRFSTTRSPEASKASTNSVTEAA
jgi:transcriptional regulator GlxA family with amidase domain